MTNNTNLDLDLDFSSIEDVAFAIPEPGRYSGTMTASEEIINGKAVVQLSFKSLVSEDTQESGPNFQTLQFLNTDNGRKFFKPLLVSFIKHAGGDIFTLKYFFEATRSPVPCTFTVTHYSPKAKESLDQSEELAEVKVYAQVKNVVPT